MKERYANELILILIKKLLLFVLTEHSFMFVLSSDFSCNTSALADGSDDRRHDTEFKLTFRQCISRIKPLDTRWYVPGCVYMVGVTRTRPIFDLDRDHWRAHREAARPRAPAHARKKSFSSAAQLEILYAMPSAPLCASYGQ